MVDSCCAPGCTNHRRQSKHRAFYRIPKDPARREKWISAIQGARSVLRKTENWTPSPNGYRLCSDHFISGKKSDNPFSPDYVPSVFKHVPSPIKKRGNMLLDTFNGTQAGPSFIADCAELKNDSHFLDDDGDIGPTCDSDNCKTQIHSLKLQVQALRAENKFLKENGSKTRLTESALQNNDKQVSLLTGLPTFSILMALFHVVFPHLKMNAALTPFQQFALTLIKLRMNLSFDFLAFYFGVDSTTVSKVFKHCISVMYCRLVPSLIVWPERRILRKTLPNAFRNKPFQKTICIIDCFEIIIEKPSHTMKYLIAITPQGSICFISDGWGGRTSDKFITENSNILSHLLPGDLVLADRGFNVRQPTQSPQAFHIKIPAFTLGKKQLYPVDLESTQSLASLGIHIKTVTGAVRQKYTILQSTVPIAFTDIDKENDVMHLDKIVKICCALTNVCESVVPAQ